MDDAAISPAELGANLREIEFANRFLGGIRAPLKELAGMEARSVLDVGCGSADIPLAMVRWSRRKGRKLQVTCLDRSEQILEVARSHTNGDPALAFVQGDGCALPFADRSFDVVTCNLALHHFEPPDAVTLLREMRRVARLTPIVCDLRRSPVAYLATLAFTRVAFRNHMSRHDGPLSIRRAYTPAEALELAREAGWRRPAVRRAAFFRLLLKDG